MAIEKRMHCLGTAVLFYATVVQVAGGQLLKEETGGISEDNLLWSTLDQLNVKTILEVSAAPNGGENPLVAAVVSEAMASPSANTQFRSHGRLHQRHGGVPAAAFQQKLVFLSNGNTKHHNTSRIDVFCGKNGDCNTLSWCKSSAPASPLNFMFLSTGGGNSMRAWGSKAGDDGVFSEPAPLWTDDEAAKGKDVMFYTCDDKCSMCAFTYAEMRAVNDTVREVGEDVLIDVIQNAGNAVKNVLCLAFFSADSPESRKVDCFTTITENIGMAAWYISCWSHPSQFSFAPSGPGLRDSATTLLFTRNKNLRANDWADFDIKMGFTSFEVTSGKMSPYSGSGALVFQPIVPWTAGSPFFAFVQLEPQDKYWLWSQAWRICFGYSMTDTAVCDPIGSPDLEPNLIGFLANDRGIMYTEQIGTKIVINVVKLNLKAGKFGTHSTVVIKGPAIITAVSSVTIGNDNGGTTVSFVGESMYQPQEVYVGVLKELADGFEASVVRYSQLNTQAAEHNFTFNAAIQDCPGEGQVISSILLTPSGGSKGKPVVAFAHPGPNMAHAETFLGWGGVGARYPVAVLAEMGYTVVMPNIRGSAGKGPAFRTAIYQDWGGRDLDDIFAGKISYLWMTVTMKPSDCQPKVL